MLLKIFKLYFNCSLWDLLSSEHSHIAQVSVPLLLHCISLPHGVDTFWRLMQDQFQDSNWRVRFTAGMLSREMNDYKYYN